MITLEEAREAGIHPMAGPLLAFENEWAPKDAHRKGAFRKSVDALLAAYRASLGGGMERARVAGCAAIGWNSDSPMMSKFLEAAAPNLVVEEVERLKANLAASEARVRELAERFDHYKAVVEGRTP